MEFIEEGELREIEGGDCHIQICDEFCWCDDYTADPSDC